MRHLSSSLTLSVRLIGCLFAGATILLLVTGCKKNCSCDEWMPYCTNYFDSYRLEKCKKTQSQTPNVKVLEPRCSCKANPEVGITTHIWGWWEYMPSQYGDKPEDGYELVSTGCPPDVMFHCSWVEPESDGTNRQTPLISGVVFLLKDIQWVKANPEEGGYRVYGRLSARVAQKEPLDTPKLVKVPQVIANYFVNQASDHLAILAASPLSCEDLCKTDSSWCPHLNPDNSAAALPKGVSSLYSLFKDPNTSRIPYSSLTEMFQINKADNRCERDDITINGDRFQNSGEPCNVSTKIPWLTEPVTATITMPKKLEGMIVPYSTPIEQIEMVFTEPNNAPILSFDKKGFEKQWGGYIRRVLANPDRLIVSTPIACIMFAMKET